MIEKKNIEILIPTLDEEGNIQETINNLRLKGFNNITIIDDNSTDSTVEITKNLVVTFLKILLKKDWVLEIH